MLTDGQKDVLNYFFSCANNIEQSQQIGVSRRN